MYNLLKNYVDRLKKEDIVNFAIKKNILLDKNELEVVYHNIKTRFKDIYDDVPILDNGNITIGNSKYLASKNVVTFEEHYNYNFDSKKLVYKLSIIYEDNLGGFGFEREIEL